MVMNPDDRVDATLAELTAGRYEEAIARFAVLILNCVQWSIDNLFKSRESGDSDGIFFQGA